MTVPSQELSVTLSDGTTQVDLGLSLPGGTLGQAEQDQYLRKYGVQYAANSCSPQACGCNDNESAYQCVMRCMDWKCFALAALTNIWMGVKIMDVNGDGLKDFLTWSVGGNVYPGMGPSYFLNLWINTGRNQFSGPWMVGLAMSSQEQETLDKFLNVASFQQAFVYDVNSDGLQDLVIIDASSKQAYALTSFTNETYSGTSGVKFSLMALTLGTGVPQFFTDTTKIVVYDVNGDGVNDVVFGDGTKVAIAYQGGVDHDLLDTITDGNGKVESVTYVAGKATGSYTDNKPQSKQSKAVHVLPPVVSTHTVTAPVDPTSPTQTETYTYQNGRVGFGGRGFTGFFRNQ